MDFIDDIDFFTRLIGGVVHLFPKFTDVIYAGIASGVHFDNVERPALGDGLAHLAGVAGITLAVGQAVNCLGEGAGSGCLTGSPRAAEKISMGDLIIQQGVQ